jgi:hypothetical protein
LVLSLFIMTTVPSPAAEGVMPDKDLTSVILLLGLPCGKVASAKRQTGNDYLAQCTDGHRYRVFVNPEGRVVAAAAK